MTFRHFFILLLVSSSLLAEEKFQVGNILPLSGAYHEYAHECQEGFKMAERESSDLLKQKIQFLVEDDQSTPKGAVNALQKLLINKNLLAVSLFSSSPVLANQSNLVTNRLPMLGLSGHPDFLPNNPYAVSNWQETSTEAKAYFNWLTENNIKSLGIVTFENDYPLAVRKYLKEWSEKSGISISFDEEVVDSVDFRALIARIKKNPPEVFMVNLLAGTFVPFVRQLREQGYQGKILSLNANGRNEYLKSIGIEASNGIIFFGPNYHQEYFLSRLAPNVLEEMPLSYVYTCYLGMKLITTKLEKRLESNTLSKENFLQDLISAESFMIDDQKIGIKNRRINFDFAKMVAQEGRIVHDSVD